MLRELKDVSDDERQRTLSEYDALLGSARESFREWLTWRYEVLDTEARRLGVVIWPDLCDELAERATSETIASEIGDEQPRRFERLRSSRPFVRLPRMLGRPARQ